MGRRIYDPDIFDPLGFGQAERRCGMFAAGMPPTASKIDIPVLAASPPARASHVDFARCLPILPFIAFEVSGAGAFALSINPAPLGARPKRHHKGDPSWRNLMSIQR
jgi:hypothetical protein